jgi:hypothetical protein
MMQLGRFFSTSVAGTAMVLLLGACVGTGPKVNSSYDPATDFSQLRTFGFVQPLAASNQSGRSTVSHRLAAATTRELQSRGLQFVGHNPDLLINIYLHETADSQERITSYAHAHQSFSTWSGYDARAMGSRAISEGTISVDVFDTRRNRLVFEGFAQDRVTEAMRDQLDDTINDAIASIFENFPK